MFNISLSKISISDLKKYTKFIMVFIIILFFVGGYFFWWPKYQEFRKSQINLDVESEKVKKKKDYVFELENSLSGMSDYEEEILKISAALPLEYSVSYLFSFVQKTASENGLIIKEAGLPEGLSNSPKVLAPGSIEITNINFSVTLTGEYPSFEDFISSMYRSSRLVEIRRIDISPAEAKGGEEAPPGLFDFELDLYANYYNKIE
jgi:Tfp pilus assembly protein PilO